MAVDELQVLTTSIGEYTVDTIGKDHLVGLQVTMDRAEHCGHIAIVLADNSDDEQKRVLRELFEIEQVFFDEAALTFSFVAELDDEGARLAAVPIYSLA